MPYDRKPVSIREKNENAGRKWSVAEERSLHEAFWRQKDIHVLSVKHGRTSYAVRLRLEMLGLLDAAGTIIRPKPAFTRSRPLQNTETKRNVPETPKVTEHCDDAQLLDLFYRLSMKQRSLVLSFVRMLVTRLDES